MELPAHGLRILLPQFIKVSRLNLNEEAADHHAGGIRRSDIMRRKGVNSTTAVKLTRDYGVILGAMVYRYPSGNYPLGYVSAAENDRLPGRSAVRWTAMT